MSPGDPKSSNPSEGDNEEFRQGKWTGQEEDFAQGLIEQFQSGQLSLADGTSLRQFLAKMLRCRPKRISKKFEGNNYAGGRKFYVKSSSRLSPDEANARCLKLCELERQFKASLQVPGMQSDGKMASVPGGKLGNELLSSSLFDEQDCLITENDARTETGKGSGPASGAICYSHGQRGGADANSNAASLPSLTANATASEQSNAFGFHSQPSIELLLASMMQSQQQTSGREMSRLPMSSQQLPFLADSAAPTVREGNAMPGWKQQGQKEHQSYATNPLAGAQNAQMTEQALHNAQSGVIQQQFRRRSGLSSNASSRQHQQCNFNGFGLGTNSNAQHSQQIRQTLETLLCQQQYQRHSATSSEASRLAAMLNLSTSDTTSNQLAQLRRLIGTLPAGTGLDRGQQLQLLFQLQNNNQGGPLQAIPGGSDLATSLAHQQQQSNVAQLQVSQGAQNHIPELLSHGGITNLPFTEEELRAELHRRQNEQGAILSQERVQSLLEAQQRSQQSLSPNINNAINNNPARATLSSSQNFNAMSSGGGNSEAIHLQAMQSQLISDNQRNALPMEFTRLVSSFGSGDSLSHQALHVGSTAQPTSLRRGRDTESNGAVQDEKQALSPESQSRHQTAKKRRFYYSHGDDKK